MARKVTLNWQDALKALDGSRIVAHRLESPGVLLLSIEMVNEEPRILRIEGKAAPGLSGNILVLGAVFQIELLEPENESEVKLAL